jgi:hypothetical protein
MNATIHGAPDRPPWLPRELLPENGVLIVEDDDPFREALLDALADRGFFCVGAANGREAWICCAPGARERCWST